MQRLWCEAAGWFLPACEELVSDLLICSVMSCSAVHPPTLPIQQDGGVACFSQYLSEVKMPTVAPQETIVRGNVHYWILTFSRNSLQFRSVLVNCHPTRLKRMALFHPPCCGNWNLYWWASTFNSTSTLLSFMCVWEALNSNILITRNIF